MKHENKWFNNENITTDYTIHKKTTQDGDMSSPQQCKQQQTRKEKKTETD